MCKMNKVSVVMDDGTKVPVAPDAVVLDMENPDLSSTKVVKSRKGMSLYFNDIHYEVTLGNAKNKCFREGAAKHKEILHGLSGYVRPGEMLAIMGPSGSGKTSLLNLLAGRLGSPSQGQMLFAGRPRDKFTRRKVAYVTQEDLFFSKLSVIEVLTFTARVRLPDKMTRAEKDERVVEVMKKLGLTKAKDTNIGDGLFNKGISGGERKRVGIANELLTDPSVLLLDEPTSGLDSNTALTVVKLLKGLANEGKTVITTIHQPSSQMFAEFDKLLLLADGSSVYFGEAKGAYDYFSKVGFSCPFGYNLADYFLQLLTEEDLNDGEPVKEKLISAWKKESDMAFDNTVLESEDVLPRSLVGSVKNVVRSIKGLAGMNLPDGEGSVSKHSVHRTDLNRPEDYERKYVTSWWTQFKNLSWRAFRQKRGALLEPWPIVQVACTLALVGLVWFQMAPTEATILDRVGNLFFTTVFWGFFTMLTATYAFPAEKAVIRKDRAAGAYCLSAYFLAKSTMELPLDIVYPTVYGVIVYWMVGLNPNVGRFFTYMLLLLTHVVVAQSAGLCISAATMNVKKATVLASVFLLGSMMVAGYYVNTENLPVWIRWLQYVSFIVYSFSAFLVNEVDGQTYECTEPPTIFRRGPCPIQDTYIYETYDLRTNLGVWGNFGVMILFIVVFRLGAYLFLRLLHRKHKRA